MAAGLALSFALGFIGGGLTAAGAYALYPPAKDQPWPILALAVASALFVLGGYLTAFRLGAVRTGEALVVGYGLAVLLAASVVVSREVAHAVREHVPQYLGVKRVGLSRVEASG